ncbi:unnamed protein product [Prunus brigantina]
MVMLSVVKKDREWALSLMRFLLWERIVAPLCSMVNYVIDPHRVFQNGVSTAMKYTRLILL